MTGFRFNTIFHKTKQFHRAGNFSKTIAILPVFFISLFFSDCGHSSGQEVRDSLRWWKGNLHTHTLWSDGQDYPEMVTQWYKDHGYHFLALSDHNILSEGQKWIDVAPGDAVFRKYLERFGPDWVEQKATDDRIQVRLKPISEFRCLFEEPGRFLLFQAEEISDTLAHLNAINISRPIPPQGGNSPVELLQNNVNAVIAQSRETGRPMFCQINHPNFRWALTAEDIMQIRDEKFFEIYNAHPLTQSFGDSKHAGTERMWDIILTKRLAELNLPLIYGIAADDAHVYHQWGPAYANPGRAWIVVRSHHLSPESIIRAMDAGDFYASTGVAFKDILFDGRTLKLVIRPENGISYITQFIGTLRGYDSTSRSVVDANGIQIRTTRIYSNDIGKILVEIKGTISTYTFTGNEIYVRAKVISTRSKDNTNAGIAWVQPVVPGVIK